jgi:hypothetical protein
MTNTLPVSRRSKRFVKEVFARRRNGVGLPAPAHDFHKVRRHVHIQSDERRRKMLPQVFLFNHETNEMTQKPETNKPEILVPCFFGGFRG